MKARIGENLRYARKQAKQTQKEAAVNSGYSVRWIRELEHEGTTDLDVLEVFAKVYEVPLIKLIYPPEKWRSIALEMIPYQVIDYFCRDDEEEEAEAEKAA